jgi:hypothetical protein
MNLNEAAMRILAELEEAHAENITSTMNTIFVPTGEAGELDEFKIALEQLIGSDLVNIAYSEGPNGRLQSAERQASLAAVQSLDSSVEFDSRRQLWVWDTKKPRAHILATQDGIAKAIGILEELGYQWWKQKP